VRAEIEKDRTMSNADVMDYARDATWRLVRKETDLRGSKMLAYEAVASKVGKSPSWVRKLLSRHRDARVDLPTWMNIRRHYEHLCERVEADAAALRAELHSLKDNIDAVDPRLNREMDASLASLAGQAQGEAQ
jgi:hypothetical protein